LVEKIWNLIIEIYQELFAYFCVDMDTFLDNFISKQDEVYSKIKGMLQFLKPALKYSA